MASPLLEKLKKASTIKESAIFGDSKFFSEKDLIQTAIPMMNVALGGSFDSGFAPGLTAFCGPSKHFKTSMMLVCVKAFVDKYKDGIVLFYDSEFGSPQSYFTSFGIDTTRVFHSPITDLEQLKFDIMQQINGLTRADKVMIIIDSVGNLASKKEVDDALDGKSVSDMTRAKQMKSLFRMVTPHLTIKDIPMMVVAHTYQTQEMYSKTVVSGGCLAAGTKIIMFDGNTKEIEKIVVGDLVKTMNGPKLVTHTWNPETLEEGTPECYRIEFNDGHSVVCSESHPFLVNGQWVPANMLSAETVVSVL